MNDEIRRVANARWGLLRKVINSKSLPISTDDVVSIHSFRGFCLIPPPLLVTAESHPNLAANLSKLASCNGFQVDPTEIYRALAALGLADEGLIRRISNDDAEIVASPLPEGSCIASASHMSHDEKCVGLEYSEVQLTSFCVRCYDIAGCQVFCRERLQPKPSLAELTSHREHGIDNTGNICVWDSEKTLAWSLHQESVDELNVVLELGSGMAALAALSLVGKAKHIVLTDGNPQCVENNLVNARMMQAIQQSTPLSTTHTRIDCCILRWGEEMADYLNLDISLADLAIVSDCTHFEMYHRHLLTTIVRFTKVGGAVWMCQPNRGRSLSNFLGLVEKIDHSSFGGMFSIEEKEYPEIDQQHDYYLKHDPLYNEDIHRPRIIVLSKVRQETESDFSFIFNANDAASSAGLTLA